MGTGYSNGEGARVGKAGAIAGAGAREGGTGRHAAGAVAYFTNQGIGGVGRCFLPRPDRRSTGAGSADAVEMEAALAGSQGQAASAPAGEAPVAVEAHGEIGAE